MFGISFNKNRSLKYFSDTYGTYYLNYKMICKDESLFLHFSVSRDTFYTNMIENLNKLLFVDNLRYGKFK